MPDINDVFQVLRFHCGPYCTLNRLWLKHHKGENRRKDDPGRYSEKMVLEAPELNDENTTITIESKTTDYLYELAGPSERREPYREDTPVVIVHFRGNDYLIDGGKRSHKWHKENSQDEHEAYVVTVNEKYNSAPPVTLP